MDSFAAVAWDGETRVDVTTLDCLIERFGLPAFCKIDVEGSQLEVLRGLSRALRVIAFEYIPLTVEVARGYLVIRFGVGLVRKRWPLKEIESVEIVRNRWWYGWGIRRVPGAWMFNVSVLDAVEQGAVGGDREPYGAPGRWCTLLVPRHRPSDEAQLQQRLAQLDTQAVVKQLALGASLVLAALGQLVGTTTHKKRHAKRGAD